MDKKQTLIKGIKRFKKKLLRKYKINKLILFGSRAKGTFKKDSDVDLTIISENFKKIPFLDRNRGLYLMWDMDYRVDFFCYTPEEFDKLKNRLTIAKVIAKEGIII